MPTPDLNKLVLTSSCCKPLDLQIYNIIFKPPDCRYFKWCDLYFSKFLNFFFQTFFIIWILLEKWEFSFFVIIRNNGFQRPHQVWIVAVGVHDLKYLLVSESNISRNIFSASKTQFLRQFHRNLDDNFLRKKCHFRALV